MVADRLSDRPNAPPRSVRFQVLGEIDVLVDGHPLDVGHPRQRCVLAALLVEVGRPVAADELIERVWAGRPPHRARNALSAYVSRLRQLLAAVPGAQIARATAGYVVAADPSTVDLHEFRRLAALARRADDPDGAVELYRRALELWHGEPFSAVGTPWFDDVRASLLAERYAVVLDRTDAALRAGRHADVLVELTDAVRVQPLDERLTGQLMLAQYRSGRQADALRAFRSMRERLADELGVDPGAELSGVHQQILTGEAAAPPPPPSPRPTAPAAAPEPAAEPEPAAAAAEAPGADAPTALVGDAAAPAPTALPRRATSFVGRRDDVAQIAAAVGAGRLVTLTGVGGVGKSRLAEDAAQAAAQGGRYPDGTWMCELAPLQDDGPVGHAVAAALHLQQRQGSTIEQTIIEYLRDRALLLVVDNCEHVLDPAAGLLADVVRHCPGIALLATSREPLGVEGEQVLPVEPLRAADAALLFTDRARAVRPGFDPDGEAPGAVADICRRLDGLPLGIELAAARMRAMNAAELADRLAGPRLVSARTRGGPARHQSLVAAVDWSHRLLSEPEQVLFRRLSVFAGGFDLEAAHHACGRPGDIEDDTLDLLTGLVDKSMVTVVHTTDVTWYRMLETMRKYGRERLEDDEAVDARGRHARYLVDLVARAGAGLLGPDERRWVERLTRAYDDLRVAVRWAITTRDTDLALRLLADLPDFTMWRVGYELTDWAESALQLPGATAHPLAPAVAGGGARGAWCLGDYPRATRLARACGERGRDGGAARCGHAGDVLAVIDGYERRVGSAIVHYEGQIELAREAGDGARLNWVLFHLAMCRAAVRDPLAGRPEAEEALVVGRELENPTAVCLGLLGVGRALQRTDPSTALALLEESAEVAASVRNRWFAAFAGMYAASSHAVHSDPATAAAAFVEVIDGWDRLGDWSQQWLTVLYATVLLNRLGASTDTVVLHYALVAAAKPTPIDADRLAAVAEMLGPDRFDAAARRGSGMDGPAVVRFVRSALRAHCGPAADDRGAG